MENALEAKGLKLEELPTPLRDRYEHLMGDLRTSLAELKQEHDNEPEDESKKQVYEDSLSAYEDMANDLMTAMDEFKEERDAEAGKGAEPEKKKEGGQAATPATEEKSDNTIWWLLGAGVAAVVTLGAVNLFRNKG